MTHLHVACALEGDYDAHGAAMLHSVLVQARPLAVHAHVLHGSGLASRSLRRLEQMVVASGGSLTGHRMAPQRVVGLAGGRFTGAGWYRIFLPELLPDTRRILYLDADTLALAPLGPLWQTELNGFYLGAVTNVLMPHHAHRPATLGLEGPDGYFNSGVLLMNLDLMRADDCATALLRFGRKGGEALEWPDQDALNVVLGHRRLPLHPRWNAMNSLRFPWAVDVFGETAVAEARRAPGIRHFEGPGDNKPWDPADAHADRDLYFAHRRHTPWPRPRLHEAAGPLGQAGRAGRRGLRRVLRGRLTP